MPEKDYRYGCPLCGVHHRPGSIVGLSGMNRKCIDRWRRMTESERAHVAERASG